MTKPKNSYYTIVKARISKAKKNFVKDVMWTTGILFLLALGFGGFYLLEKVTR